MKVLNVHSLSGSTLLFITQEKREALKVRFEKKRKNTITNIKILDRNTKEVIIIVFFVQIFQINNFEQVLDPR